MRKTEATQAKMTIDAIERARNEIKNLQANSELSTWAKNKREYELCQAIDLLKSDMVDLVTRMIQNQTILKEVA